MDDIQLVDCFEKAHQHLLRHEPDLQNRIAAAGAPGAYRGEPLSFFLTHLASIVSGLDERTAEGKRRIRRFLIDLDDARPADSAEAPMAVRERCGIFARPLSEAQKRLLLASLRNLEAMDGQSQRPLGEDFAREIDRRECLPDRLAWLRQTLPCLTGLSAFRYLSRIGYPILEPNRRSQAFLFRLGLLEKTAGTLKVRIETCHLGQRIAQALKRPIGEINYWIAALTGNLSGLAPRTALCTATPQCKRCDLSSYCAFYRFNSAHARSGDAPLPLREWSQSEKPRERLIEHGAANLADVELLAIVLRTGAGRMNVLELARCLLERFGSLRGIEEASIEELRTLHGIGALKAIELKAVFELGRRQNYRPLRPGDLVETSDAIFETYRERFRAAQQEEFLVLMLDVKHKVIREEAISRGGLDGASAHPREVFKAAIRSSAAAVFFIHNHPSGDPRPSHDDEVITKRLNEAGELLQIDVLDHLIIGSDSYYSFRDMEVVTPGPLGEEVAYLLDGD